MKDLQISVLQTPGKIETNFAELEAQLRLQMQAYEELEVTEENIPERKSDVATLRKIRKAIDDRRKDVKKLYSQPLADFEGKVKNLTGIIDEQISRINEGLSAFETKRKQEKQAHVVELYKANIGDFEEFLPLQKIQSPQWLNKTCSDNEIIGDIQTMTLQVQNDLNVIHSLGSEIEEELIRAYRLAGNSLGAAVKRNADYQQAALFAVQKAQEAASKAKVAEAPKEQAEKPTEPKNEPFMNEPVMTIRVRGQEDITALQTFLDLSGIEYEEVQG